MVCSDTILLTGLLAGFCGGFVGLVVGLLIPVGAGNTEEGEQ